MAKVKIKQRERSDENSIEAAKSIGKGVVDSFKNDLVKESVHDLWKQLLSVKEEPDLKTKGDLIEGEEISFKKTEKKKNIVIEAGINYKSEMLYGEKRIRNEQNQMLSVRVEEIIHELKKLAKTSKTLEIEFRGITQVSMPKTPGKYHQNFLEWMLTVVKTARIRVENAEQWLKAVSGKGKRKKDFWGLYKKHGTSFGLSGERAVSQQTG